MSTAGSDPLEDPDHPVWQPGSPANRRLMLHLRFEGPWERAMHWLFATRPDGTIWRTVRQGSVREWLATWCEMRDIAWRTRHACRGSEPSARWRRRQP